MAEGDQGSKIGNFVSVAFHVGKPKGFLSSSIVRIFCEGGRSSEGTKHWILVYLFFKLGGTKLF